MRSVLAGAAGLAAVGALAGRSCAEARDTAAARIVAAHSTTAGALDVAARVLAALDGAVIARLNLAPVHVVAFEVAALTAAGRAAHGVVATHVAVVAAAAAALLRVGAFEAAVVRAFGCAMLEARTGRVTAVVFAAQQAFVPAATSARLARTAEVVVVARDRRREQEQNRNRPAHAATISQETGSVPRILLALGATSGASCPGRLSACRWPRAPDQSHAKCQGRRRSAA